MRAQRGNFGGNKHSPLQQKRLPTVWLG